VKKPADPEQKVNQVRGLGYYYVKNSSKRMEVKYGLKVLKIKVRLSIFHCHFKIE
jgi:hypothetical protein